MNEEAMPLGCAEVEPLLDPYIDGELDDARVHLVAAHLSACVRCAEEVAACSATARALRTALDVSPPEDLWASVRARVRTQRQRPWAWRVALVGAALAACAAIALVLAPARNAGPRLASAERAAPKPLQTKPQQQRPMVGPPQETRPSLDASPAVPAKRIHAGRRSPRHVRARKPHTAPRRYAKPVPVQHAPAALARADRPVLVVVSEPADPQPQPPPRELSASYSIAVSPDTAGPDGLKNLNVAKQYGPDGDLQRLSISFTLPGNLVASPMEGDDHDEGPRKGSIDVPDNWTMACSY